ncbi:transient receptor potential channel pyrexia [Papilio machaon]|uniref:transient receptor potential channel pyrexia n=1 Tax=Papilio machaon TaxID=76193 RepID=UPI001E66512A|nr:transient receptor potential channel pyrexia [Papilio machaon]
MCTKGVFSLFNKDVEEGYNEDRDNLQPLININNPHDRLRPNRPQQLGFADTMPEIQKMHIYDSSPSVMSTPDVTPAPEIEDIWPRKFRRSDRRLRRLNTELLEAIENHEVEEVERLLHSGANPNATCRLDLVSACHIAAITGGEALGLLVKFGAEKHRLDRLGRTPLHLAAFAGNARQVAIMLDFPEEMQDRVESDMSSDAEEDVKKMCPRTRDMVNVRCDVGDVRILLPKTWKDNIDHNCKNIEGTLPLLQPGWTPLHVAAACARMHCTRLLLAAGADPNICDEAGRTALDVAGYGYYFNRSINKKNFLSVLQMLLNAGGTHNTMKTKGINNIDTPLHTAVEMDDIDSINELLGSGASVKCLNSSGLTPLHVCVKKELEEALQVLANYNYKDADPFMAMVDVKDKDGHTVLQAAVEAAWVPGVCVALEAGADVTLKANDGETPIHSAAALGNLDVLTEILSLAKQTNFIDCQNEEGETPLFKAIVNENLDCVQAILQEGASIKLTMPGDVNVFHVAAENGRLDILKTLLEYDDDVTRSMINSLTAGDRRGFGPIHFAVANNHSKCVQLLLSKNADIRLRTTNSPHGSSTPLHIAAVYNHIEIANVILKFDKTTIHEVNGLGWFPLHTASHHGSRDVITLLLQEGGDLSGYTDGPKKYRRTAIDMIVNNLSKPTDFLEDVFDSYISSTCQNFKDANCEITVDYRILMPTICEMEQMKVIEALLKTGNRYGQKRLLVHPLVESFLFLKWKALLPFFYTIIAVYSLFVTSLTIFIVSVFFYMDTKETAPIWLNQNVWGYIVYSTIFLILVQELLYMNIKSSRYLFQIETWIKFGSIGLAMILPAAVMMSSWLTAEWLRHVATLALLLSWVELMFLLSRFPNGGYYVLMFGKVASNVIRIILTFAFLIIGFALSFMIQFHSQIPFEGPWAAFVKTMVMMTSEFDYVALFDAEHSKDLATSLIIVRVVFLIFLILAAIVLMNLLVGVAVNDINDLEILGNIRRLAKQVEFLSTLDNLVYNKFFTKILPNRINNHIKTKRRVIGTIMLCPGKPRWRHNKVMPTRIRDAIMNKAQMQQKQREDELGLQMFNEKLNAMYEIITKQDRERKKQSEIDKTENTDKYKMRHDNVMKRLHSVDNEMKVVKEQINTSIENSESSVDKLNVKIDQMSLEIEEIKQFLSRLESKLDSL